MPNSSVGPPEFCVNVNAAGLRGIPIQARSASESILKVCNQTRWRFEPVSDLQIRVHKRTVVLPSILRIRSLHRLLQLHFPTGKNDFHVNVGDCFQEILLLQEPFIIKSQMTDDPKSKVAFPMPATPWVISCIGKELKILIHQIDQLLLWLLRVR